MMDDKTRKQIATSATARVLIGLCREACRDAVRELGDDAPSSVRNLDEDLAGAEHALDSLEDELIIREALRP